MMVQNTSNSNINYRPENVPNVFIPKTGAKPKSPVDGIKKAIWIYFYLLIFEGALRKWVLPFLATPLLLVRDPIIIWALSKANSLGLFPKSAYVSVSITVGIITILTAMVFGHGNLFVAFYGARSWIFYIPFIFLIGKVFTQEDVLQMGKATLWIVIPMTILIMLQFYSPQSAFVNRGVGGDDSGAGFNGALGFFRPPGTFSFTNGVTLFYGFASTFVFYFWLYPGNLNRIVLYAATAGLLASIPLSISRGLFFEVCTVAAFVILASARKPQFAGRIIGAAIGLVILVLLLSKLSTFQTAIEAFTHRFDVASDQEGGLEGTLVDRFLLGSLKPFFNIGGGKLFGAGSGIYTNVGTKLLSGNVISGIAEGEIGRIVGEIGPVFGLIVVVIRISMSIKSFRTSYRQLTLGEVLPWTLLPFSLIMGPQANWAQPTSLGFAVLSIGLVFASVNKPRLIKKQKMPARQ